MRTRSTAAERDLMKVATFNINDINKRLDQLLAWLAEAEPDVVSLQELKAEQGKFPMSALRTLGYEAVWQGERSWNGVAILARNHVPVLTCASLPGNPEDRQARYIEAAVHGFLITSIYLPNAFTKDSGRPTLTPLQRNKSQSFPHRVNKASTCHSEPSESASADEDVSKNPDDLSFARVPGRILSTFAGCTF